MAVTYEAITTYTAPSNQSSITFTGISQSYTDLVLVGTGKSSATGNPNIFIRVGNGSIDTSANYSWTRMYGTGSTAGSSSSSNSSDGVIWGDYTPNSFTADTIYFQNYSNTVTYKTLLTRNNSESSVHASVGLWRSTSAINQISLYCPGRDIVTGSTFTLYGIKAA